MARQKSRKTALKRLRRTNPKGKKNKGKLLYKQSGQHHLKTKLSTRTKRRKETGKKVHSTIEKKYKKIVSI